MIVTNIGADFTALGSFGDALQFGENLVASMDRSFLKRAPQWAQPKEGVQVCADRHSFPVPFKPAEGRIDGGRDNRAGMTALQHA